MFFPSNIKIDTPRIEVFDISEVRPSELDKLEIYEMMADNHITSTEIR